MTDYLDDLRQLESEIANLDTAVTDLQTDLKAAKVERDKAVQRLREAVREGKVVVAPLFELVESEAVDG